MKGPTRHCLHQRAKPPGAFAMQRSDTPGDVVAGELRPLSPAFQEWALLVIDGKVDVSRSAG